MVLVTEIFESVHLVGQCDGMPTQHLHVDLDGRIAGRGRW